METGCFSVKLSNATNISAALKGSAAVGVNTNIQVTILDDETPGNTDYAFNPGLGTDNAVNALVLQADGKTHSRRRVYESRWSSPEPGLRDSILMDIWIVS